jgi:hypothetical protein
MVNLLIVDKIKLGIYSTAYIFFAVGICDKLPSLLDQCTTILGLSCILILGDSVVYLAEMIAPNNSHNLN